MNIFKNYLFVAIFGLITTLQASHSVTHVHHYDTGSTVVVEEQPIVYRPKITMSPEALLACMAVLVGTTGLIALISPEAAASLFKLCSLLTEQPHHTAVIVHHCHHSSLLGKWLCRHCSY